KFERAKGSKRFHFASLHYIFSAYLPTHIKFLTEFLRIFFGTTCISFPYFICPPSFGKLFSKLSAKIKENIRFWQGIPKIICQNREKYGVLASYLQNCLPKPKKKGIFVYI
ncbi:MAG: hypothetical protein SPF86_10180, partial [Sodaliphilus sp.]|nr:hypothetical protein [Bacteroidales bacterium]MDY5539622.1 hypothetical protein [Sodaliphilus sp.]